MSLMMRSTSIPSQISDMSVAFVKRSGICMLCTRERRAPGGSRRCLRPLLFLKCSEPFLMAGTRDRRCGLQEGIADAVEILPLL
jgi:hypothetical protein